jgi:putative copper resistance protein D
LIWLLRDIDLLSTLLRAANLSFEALLLGGIVYLLAVARPARAGTAVESFCLRGIRWAALALALSEVVSVTLSSASLLGDSDLQLRDLLSTRFFQAGLSAALLAMVLWVCGRVKSRKGAAAMIPLSLLLLVATVSASHAAARMDNRWLLGLATGIHHLGTAAWIGAMPFLLISLPRTGSVEEARLMARRYSSMAMLSVAALVLAGVYLAWSYVGTWNGLYGTNYGVLLLAKIYLLVVMLLMGVGNWLVVRRLDTEPLPLLAQLRRFAEAEVGLGFTAILAAASMSAQVRVAEYHPTGASDDMDRKWSEYNHHWAGLIVLAAGLLAFASRFRGMRWARFWPLSFAGLSVFILLRADPENWPLGPRPFWASFSSPDVLQHRAAAVLILCFAVFECAVQAGKLQVRWASMIFPAMCALGAAVLLTHNHAPSDVQEGLLASLSHTPIALLGATAGWGRWLELRLPPGRPARIASFLWPLFLAAAGLVLLNYREA